MAQRLYVLTQVSKPAGVPGRFMQADASHTELIAEWMRAFEREALGEEPRTRERAIAGVAPRIAAGDWFLWEDGGRIVSMCLKTRPNPHRVRGFGRVHSAGVPPPGVCGGVRGGAQSATAGGGLQVYVPVYRPGQPDL